MSADVDEDIAIVGIGCRFPGANDIHEFWKLLENAENHVKDIPKDRWDNDKFYSNNADEPGKIYVQKAGLLSEHDKWDNRLFGISDIEAVRVDPQQRYVLECTHMALEDGGLTRKQLSGTRTGVFIGVMNDDYKTLTGTDHMEDTNFTATGLSTTVIASRVSYVFNLQGPCMTVDTACSSAMMALHLGCQAIRAGDCEIAICGGVSSIISPDMFIPLCKARMLSRVGQCQTFCNTADGYARGEGCGIVILRSLKKASHIEKIWGILQTGANQDGRVATPMTAPSSKQQQKLLHTIYKKYETHPMELDYIEVHGTGTPIGDPTEVDAISTYIKTYEENTKESNRRKKILMGSVKTNIGHTESAAAVAGIIKVLLMMKHEKFVRSLHLNENMSNLNKRINLDGTPLAICVKSQNWPKNQFGNRVACVNSFGFGGSNGHAIIKQFVDRTGRDLEVRRNPDGIKHPYFVCLSGTDKESLSGNINNFATDLDSFSEGLPDISYTSLLCRDKFERRTLLFGTTIQDICQRAKLKMVSMGETIMAAKRNLVMVFCGVGTTWSGMGAEMMTKHAVFRNTVRQIDEYLKVYSNVGVEKMLSSTQDYSDPFLSHIAIFTVQVSLYELWKSLGVIPDTIIGQSVGEVAAAYASGALNMSSAVKVIYHRAKILAQQTSGKMTVVGNMAVADIEKECSKYEGSLNIAVYNSPTSCTMSGTAVAIEGLERDIRNFSDSFIRQLNVTCAYHSHLMDDCLSDIISKLTGLESGCEPCISQVSTVTGKSANKKELISSTYWAQNVRQPVLFMQAIRMSVRSEYTNVYLEIGPRQVLRMHLPNIINEGSKFLCLPSMNKNDENCFYSSLSSLYDLGTDININSLLQYDGKLSPLPRYHFNKTASLFISPLTKQYLFGYAKSRGSEKYVEQVADTNFSILVSQDTTPFVFDHRLLGSVTVPGATYIEAAITGACHIMDIPATDIELSVMFENPCMIEKDQRTELSLSFKQNSDICEKSFEFRIHFDERFLCMGTVTEKKSKDNNDVDEVDVSTLRLRLMKHKTADEIYRILEKIGLTYGESLRLIKWCCFDKSECLVAINLPSCIRCDLRKFILHPAIADAMFQTSAVISSDLTEDGGRGGIPKGFTSLMIKTAPQEKMLIHTKLVRKTRINSYYKSVLSSQNGAIIAEMNDLVIRRIDSSIPNDGISYDIKWRPMKPFNETYIDGQSESLILFGSRRLRCWLSEAKLPFTFVEIPDDQSVFEQLATESIRNSPNVRNVVFGPCLNSNDTEYENTKDIYDIIISNIIHLQTILKLKQSNSDDSFQISIVTEMTQLLSQQNPDKSNYIGAELWGFARSVMTEMPFIDIRLIDIDLKKENISLFLSLLTDAQSESTETLIREGRIYVSEICSSATQDIAFIHSKQIETSEKLSLCSDSIQVVSQPFLAYTNRKSNREGKKKPKDNFANYIVAKVFINRSKKINSATDIQVVVSGNIEKPIAQLKAIEFLGWLEEDNRYKNQENMYGICFPITVSTVVALPKCCAFLLKDIPFYKPGLVSEVALLWHVTDQIKAKSNVLICVCNKKCWRANLILEILRYHGSRGTVLSWDDFDVTEVVQERYTSAIVVQVRNVSEIRALNIFSEIQLVICVNRWLPWDPESVRLRLISQKKIITIKAEDTFREDILIKLVPRVLKYLKNSISDIERLLSPTMTGNVPSDQEFPYSIIDVQTKPMETNLPVLLHPSSSFKKEGHYIFVGGTSGLGWELLQYCAKLGAGNLVTLSRRNLSDEKAAEMKRIATLYRCSVTHIQADITDLRSLHCIFSALKKNAEVKGIFHGGGVLKDTLLENMTKEQLEIVLKPKVLGTLNLHEVSKNMSLDFFVTHSSITAIFGNQGQCNYAAANSFQDSFAYFRTTNGYNAQSINWGALPFGMARESGQDFENRFRRQGILVLNDNDVRSCFNEIVLTKNVQKIFGIFDWQKFIKNPAHSSTQHKFGSIIREYGILQNTQSPQRGEINNLTTNFHKQTIGKQREVLQKIIFAILKDALLTETEILTSNAGLYQLGIDSMAAMSISNSLYQTTRVRVPVVFLLSNTTTIEGLINFVQTELNDQKQEGDSHNTESVHYEILDGSVTFMQASILSSLELEKPTNFIRIIGYEMISPPIGIKNWTRIIVKLLQIHPGLRQIFELNADTKTFEAKEVEIDESNVPVSVVPFKSIFETSGEVDLDPKRHIPVLLHLACKGRRTRMKVFLHAVAVDMQTINIFFRDLEFCTRNLLLGDPRPVLQSINVTETIRNALTPKFGEMKTFWKQMLSNNAQPFTFGSSLSDTLDETEWCEAALKFSETQFDDVIQFIENEKMTLYNFVLSVYILLIFEFTGLEVIPLITNINIRGFIPALNNVLTRCINEVPIFGVVKPEMTVDEYLRESTAQLNEITEHGAYPYELIKEEMASDDLQKNIGRHRFIIDDVSTVTKQSVKNDVKVKITAVHHRRHTYETCLFMYQDKSRKSLCLELGFNSKVVGKSFAEKMLERLGFLVFRIAHGNTTVPLETIFNENTSHSESTRRKSEGSKTLVNYGRITENMKGKKTSYSILEFSTGENDAHIRGREHKETQIIMKGHLEKQSKQGNVFKTKVILLRSVSPGIGSEYYLCWKYIFTAKQINVNDLREVHIKKIGGRCSLFIKTEKKWIQFFARNFSDAKSWFDLLRSASQNIHASVGEDFTHL